jgi:hypoxanthine phosphoribosyltransferase
MTKLSWEDIDRITDELAIEIKDSGFVPDYIVGITTGGLIPLYFLVKKLDIDAILTLSATSYHKEEKGDLNITYLPDIDLTGKKILLVDEIVETGDTLKTISEAVSNKYNVAEIKTVVLAMNTEKCKYQPDYYSVEAKDWVVFPWEKGEFPEYFTEQ